MATSTNFPTSADPVARPPSERAEEVRQLADRVASGAHTLVDRAVERVGPAVDRLRSSATEASSKLQQRADELGAMQQKLLEDTRTSVRSRPIAWVAAAFAVGLVIGRLGRH